MSPWQIVKRLVFVRKNVSLGKRFHVGLGSIISAPNSLVIGDDVYVGKFCTIQCNGKIGRGTLIANNVGIVGRRDHNFREVGSLVRLAAWIGEDQSLQNDPKSKVCIGEDIWIGYGSIVLSGTSIGRGAIVAAGSVVTSDVAPYDIVSGNPARTVGKRFRDQRTIALHEGELEKDLYREAG